MSPLGEVIAVVGPTASGKSEVAQLVAQALDGEVVSADSMQIYRGMDIGTGKVLPSEQRVPHWGLDLVDPGEPFSAALFQSYARNCFDSIQSRGKVPILAGGTGFYVRAALDAYDFAPGEQMDNEVRKRYNTLAESEGPQAVWDALNSIDPTSAALLHPNDVKRVVRALEMAEAGESYAQRKEALSRIGQAVPAKLFGLAVDPEVLRNRIDERVEAMVSAGLVDEVRHLLNQGFRNALTANQAIGYKEIVSALDGECTLEEAVEQIKFATHRYAKRQRTWFRADGRINWIDADDGNAQRIAQDIQSITGSRRMK